VVDDFSSKLGLSRPFERVGSIDANHMQMARCRGHEDAQYRANSRNRKVPADHACHWL
jgi:hypothetical protein